MASHPELERAIDTVLSGAEESLLGELAGSGRGCRESLDASAGRLEAEYDRIIADGKKEADKVSRKLVGEADLAARNRELVELEGAVDRVFEGALGRIRAGDHGGLAKSMLKEATDALGTTEVRVSTSGGSRGAVESALAGFPGAQMSDDVECLGGVVVRSKDGSVTFDNTIDARIERIKPLIRKEIAAKFGVGV